MAAFNTEIESLGLDAELIGDLQGTHKLNISSLQFTTVPQDATELYDVLEFFNEEIEHHESELPNATGLIIVTQNQDDLKRVDALIVWPGDEEAAQETTENVSTQAQDDAAPAYHIYAEHIFIHRDANYFAAPGS